MRRSRAFGETSLHYNWDRYTRSDLGRVATGTDQSVSIADNERFGSLERFKLNSSLSYFQRDVAFEKSDEIIGNANFNADLKPNLQNNYDFDFDHYQTGNFSSDNYGGQATLQHQLYESLVSSVTLRGFNYEASDDQMTGFNRRFGIGIGEAYTKYLSSMSRLRINNSLFVEHTDQKDLSRVENERHTVSESGAPPDSFYLNQPNVIEVSIVVTDEQDSLPGYVENLDYRVTRFGSRTLIERLAGSRIPAGGVVLVDYRTEPTPEGNYETLTESFQVRVELWQNLLGLYGRLNLAMNNAPADLRVQSITAYAVGADFNWKAVRAGVEYQLYDSDESSYRSVRLYQSIALSTGEGSSLSLDFSEAWINYLNSSRQEQEYRFVSRYHRAITHRLGLDVDAGVALRRGDGVDQVLAAFRPTLKYVIGKTSLDAGFDYEYELFLNNEQRQREMFFVRLKRYF